MVRPLIAALCRKSVGGGWDRGGGRKGCGLAKGRTWETPEGGNAEGVQPSLDFGILQRRRASLKPGESVGRYDVGDEGGRTGLRS